MIFNIRKSTVLFAAAALLATVAAASRAQEPAAGAADTSLKQISDKYAPVFTTLEQWLDTNPPLDQQQNVREQNLKIIDEAMLEKRAKELDCVGDFFQGRMAAFMRDFTSSAPGGDTFIWKLYNHTEIVQTKDITIAIDLIKGFDKVTLNDADLKEIVLRTDVLLVTHSHGDHVQPAVVDMFLDAGRPVVVPELFWPDYKRNNLLTVIRKGDLEFPGASVKVFPSFQKETPDNVYLILTDNGHSIMHIGDNNNIFQAGHEWFRKFKKPLAVDALIPNIWTPDMASLLKFIRPALLVSSHEHELGHPPAGRRTYGYVYGVLHTIKESFVVPMWGEKVVLKKKD